MTARTMPVERDPLAGSRAMALGLGGAVAIAAAILAGWPGLVACVAGCAVGGGTHALMTRGLARIMARSTEPDVSPRAAALVGFAARHVLVALALFVLVVRLELPVAWLLAGLSAWPAGLVTASLRTIACTR